LLRNLEAFQPSITVRIKTPASYILFAQACVDIFQSIRNIPFHTSFPPHPNCSITKCIDGRGWNKFITLYIMKNSRLAYFLHFFYSVQSSLIYT
ncbi:hypothetical protein VIGAN_05034800, partial [Vigna angularis var. angularis]